MYRRVARKLAEQIGFRQSLTPPLLPRQVYPDDVFLVSYPKSGNTWLRFLIGNYLTDNKCNFTNLHLTMPEIGFNNDRCDFIPRPRFIKSHFPFSTSFLTEKYPNVIYLVRDGRDVAVSYYFHLQKFGFLKADEQFGTYLDRFILGELNELSPWSYHLESWLNSQCESILFLRYEDMLADPKEGLIRALIFAGVELDIKHISAAVEASDKSTLMKLEKQQKAEIQKIIPSTDPTIPAVRKGISGDWQNYFDNKMEKRFLEVHGSGLARFGYLD